MSEKSGSDEEQKAKDGEPVEILLGVITEETLRKCEEDRHDTDEEKIKKKVTFDDEPDAIVSNIQRRYDIPSTSSAALPKERGNEQSAIKKMVEDESEESSDEDIEWINEKLMERQRQEEKELREEYFYQVLYLSFNSTIEIGEEEEEEEEEEDDESLEGCEVRYIGVHESDTSPDENVFSNSENIIISSDTSPEEVPSVSREEEEVTPPNPELRNEEMNESSDTSDEEYDDMPALIPGDDNMSNPGHGSNPRHRAIARHGANPRRRRKPRNQENRMQLENPTCSTSCKRKHPSESQSIVTEPNPSDPKKSRYSDSDSDSNPMVISEPSDTNTTSTRGEGGSQEKNSNNPDPTQDVEGSEMDSIRYNDPKCSHSLNESNLSLYITSSPQSTSEDDQFGHCSGLDLLEIERNLTIIISDNSSHRTTSPDQRDSSCTYNNPGPSPASNSASQQYEYSKPTIEDLHEVDDKPRPISQDCKMSTSESSKEVDSYDEPGPPYRKRKASPSDKVTELLPVSNKIAHSTEFENTKSSQDKTVILYQSESFRQLLRSRSVQPSTSSCSNAEYISPLQELNIGDPILELSQFPPLPSPSLVLDTTSNNEQLDERLTELDAPTLRYIKLPAVPQIPPDEDDTPQIARNSTGSVNVPSILVREQGNAPQVVPGPSRHQIYDSTSSESTFISDRSYSSTSSPHYGDEPVVILGPNGTAILQSQYDTINWANYVDAFKTLLETTHKLRLKNRDKYEGSELNPPHSNQKM